MNLYNITRHRLGLFALAVALIAGQPTRTRAENQLVKTVQPLIVVSGIVTDEQSQPIPGVNIVDKQSKKGTTTDATGRFSIDVATGTTLVMSSVGFMVQEVVVGAQTTLNITLKDDVNQLAEVVAVGYQTLRKSDVTGAVANVKARELNLTAPTIGQALVGKLAGALQISCATGL